MLRYVSALQDIFPQLYKTQHNITNKVTEFNEVLDTKISTTRGQTWYIIVCFFFDTPASVHFICFSLTFIILFVVQLEYNFKISRRKNIWGGI